MSVTLNGTSGLVFSDGTIQGTAGAMAFRNRIINGDMRIDQRNNGNSSTFTTDYVTVDRWRPSSASGGGVITMQQNAGSVTPPPGFTHYLGLTVQTAATIADNSSFRLIQIIEGNNVSDLGFGTANAKPVTISFWVRASITGIYAVRLINSFDGTLNHIKTYTILQPNTWEYKTVTIPGPTSGTFNTNNLGGLALSFQLGSGTNYNGTPDVWVNQNIETVSGAVKFVENTGATWFVTGVQLEKAAAATSFEHRPFGTELAMCERYFQVFGRAPAVGNTNEGTAILNHINGQPQRIGLPNLKTTMRAQPSITCFNQATTADRLTEFSSNSTFTVSGVFGATLNGGGYIQLTSNLINGIHFRATFNAEF